MKRLKILKQDDNNSCVGFVSAMATRTSIRRFRKFVKKKPPWSDNEAYRYLVHCGYALGIGFNNSGFEVLNEYDGISIQFKLRQYPAYVVVKSRNIKGDYHAVYWSGRRIYDPDPGIKRVGLSLEEYQIESWFPIIKMEKKC